LIEEEDLIKHGILKIKSMKKTPLKRALLLMHMRNWYFLLHLMKMRVSKLLSLLHMKTRV
jgi:hypothetical protein